jgi:hypothetical protein
VSTLTAGNKVGALGKITNDGPRLNKVDPIDLKQRHLTKFEFSCRTEIVQRTRLNEVLFFVLDSSSSEGISHALSITATVKVGESSHCHFSKRKSAEALLERWFLTEENKKLTQIKRTQIFVVGSVLQAKVKRKGSLYSNEQREGTGECFACRAKVLRLHNDFSIVVSIRLNLLVVALKRAALTWRWFNNHVEICMAIRTVTEQIDCALTHQRIQQARFVLPVSLDCTMIVELFETMHDAFSDPIAFVST